MITARDPTRKGELLKKERRELSFLHPQAGGDAEANGLRRCWSRSLGSERDQSAGSEAEGLTRDLRRKADEQPGRLAHTILW